MAKSTKKNQPVIDEEKVNETLHGIRKHTAQVRKEFLEFINRGSVVDLAIGVAVGGAFNSIVNSLVNDIVMPIVGLVAGGVNFNNLAIRIPNFFGANDEAVISYGKFLQACLQFLIIAWVFFMLVRMLNSIHRKNEEKLAQQAKREEERAKAKKAAKNKKSAANAKK